MDPSQTKFQQAYERINGLFNTGAASARDKLRRMMHREINFDVSGVQEIPFEEVSSYRFPPDVPVAMVLLRIQGNAGSGFLAFVMFEESAKKVNQILWEEAPEASEVLNTSNISALKEMGNIVGSCLLSELANASGLELRPSEPLFVYDMMAAMIQTLLLEQSCDSERAILTDTRISSEQEGLSFDILFFPSKELCDNLCQGLMTS
jgi:chemotaxis protein CheC